MKVLVFGSSLFAIAFMLHLIAWRIRLPKRHVRTMLQIFFITLFAGMIALWIAAPSFEIFGISRPDDIWEYLHICLMFVSLTLAYMITYSAIEADSPSLVMVMAIDNAEPDGLDRDKFDEMMSDDILVMPRIRDVLLDRMVYMDGDKYRLTHKGVLIARVFIFYRNLINAPENGG
jgi:hypothetical protein